MKYADRTGPVAQGDAMFIPIPDEPEGFAPTAAEHGRFIVAYSETGHHHVVLERPGVRMFQHQIDAFRALLDVPEDTDVEHLRGFDTHETIRLAPGLWEVRRQREYAPERWRRAAD